jgi:GH35 family endo-1,4-beta-xylanase
MAGVFNMLRRSDAKLFYNDYSAVIDAAKSSHKKMVAKFKAKGYPIDGVGRSSSMELTLIDRLLTAGFSDLASTSY